MNHIITVIAAATLLTGCAVTPAQTPFDQQNAMIQGAAAAHVASGPEGREACMSIANMAQAIIEGKREGYSRDFAQRAIALAAHQSGDTHSQASQMTGTLTFMAIDKIYDVPGQTHSSIYQSCVDENWLSAAYIAAKVKPFGA